MTIQEKIDNIEQKIKQHEYDYFVLGEATISRPEMEILKVELHNLKKQQLEEKESTPDTGESLFEFYDGI